MSIQVILQGAFKLCYKTKYKDIYDKYKKGIEQNSLLYPVVNDIKVGELLEDIDLPLSIISFVLINKNRHNINKDLLSMVLKDGDCIEIFPKIVGG